MAYNGNLEMVRFLLEQGANANAKDNQGTTALIGAAYNGHAEIVKALLAYGADSNAKQYDGQTALMGAAFRGHAEIVKILLADGADVSAARKDGATALTAARTGDNKRIVQLLEKSLSEDQPERIPAKRWAVIIGISKYQDTRIPQLRYATADARTFYDWIVSPTGGQYPPTQVKLLLDQNATEDNIRKVLFVWLKQALAEDMVTIYFAGHGSPESPDSTQNLFLLAYDTFYDDITTTGFPMWDIETAFRRFIKARKIIVIADACHSGGVGQSFDIARKINPIGKSFEDLSKIGDGVCIINASNEKQFSQEGKIWGGGHGVFTYFLLEGLYGKADYNRDSVVTLGELIPYISEQVRRATRNVQTPTVAGKFDPSLSIGK